MCVGASVRYVPLGYRGRGRGGKVKRKKSQFLIDIEGVLLNRWVHTRKRLPDAEEVDE